MDKALSLYQLNNEIKQTINNNFPTKQWIVAEISELRVNQNGHCYLELIEKDDKSNKIIAKARATIWAYTYPMLSSFFKSETNENLCAGLKVMVYAEVVFQEIYSYSINIVDIDPNYTLGDIARKRKETIARLENEGVLDMNKDLELNPLTKTIALISSASAAGYEDFINQLNSDSESFNFIVKLFPAIMQGENADKSITQALDFIYEYDDVFDAVVIIRGGGSQADLNCFDSYWLAYNITQFPLPVISGIGHQRDKSIVDIVSNVSLKTPTAVANFLIDRLLSQEAELLSLQNDFICGIESILNESNNKLNTLSHRFIPAVKSGLENKKIVLNIAQSNFLRSSSNFCSKQEVNLFHQVSKLKLQMETKLAEKKYALSKVQNKAENGLNSIFIKQKHKLNMWTQAMTYANPEYMLKKGYSITTYNGKLLKDSSIVREDDIIHTRISG